MIEMNNTAVHVVVDSEEMKRGREDRGGCCVKSEEVVRDVLVRVCNREATCVHCVLQSWLPVQGFPCSWVMYSGHGTQAIPLL